MTNASTYLTRFFNETTKVDHDDFFEVDVDGTWNLMSYGVVLEALFAASEAEQRLAADTIRKIDFMDGDVCHFLRHLGACMARQAA